MKLSVVVPVYNEYSHLREVVEHLFSSSCFLEREWIFVDDCSSDGTTEILKGLQKTYDFILIEHERNQGKGGAVRDGFKRATGDMIIIQDADFEYDPNDVAQLLKPLVEDRADVVYGSRFKKSVPTVHRTFHYLGNRFLTLLSNLLSGIYLTDMETCYKVFRADLVKAMNLRSSRFGIEVELTAYVAKTAARVYELPINYYPRKQLHGKKINWKDGVAAFLHLVRFNLFVSLEQAFTRLPAHYLSGAMARPTRRSDSGQ